MREIKFRGLNNNDVMVHGDLCTGLGQKCIMPECYTANLLMDSADNYIDELSVGGWVLIPNSETIGQFTGLKDVNGVEIYEGDITQYGAVEFSGGCWTLNGDRMLGVFRDAKVIGNIHQNPELLGDL